MNKTIKYLSYGTVFIIGVFALILGLTELFKESPVFGWVFFIGCCGAIFVYSKTIC